MIFLKILILILINQGVRFDPDLPATLRLEFAKSNTKVQKPKHPNQNQLTAATQQYIQIPRMSFFCTRISLI